MGELKEGRGVFGVWAAEGNAAVGGTIADLCPEVEDRGGISFVGNVPEPLLTCDLAGGAPGTDIPPGCCM